ncbi:replicative DNA helicase [Kineococcus esterisolvens]|uniref:replicative DNA helicase n=1 Tax=unclassified Kineococcus TaxID=2621656 RepID=UPI003D7DD158
MTTFDDAPAKRGGSGGSRRGGGERGSDRGPEVGSEPFERMPPQDIAAEQGVLGGMMLSKDAIADVVEVLKGVDFYRPAHELIYEAILDLYSRGEPADPVTVSAELTNRGELARVGGTPYLHDLISTVPTAANAGFYARIVRERAVLRRLVEAGTRIVQMGYGADGMDVDAIVNSAQAEVYAVTEKRVKEDYAVLGDVIEGAIDEIEASSHRGEGMVGVPTGFADLDGLTNGLHPGQMIVIAARPAVGKSTLGLDIARAASIKHGLASVIFSLEMGRNEISMRLLSAEARIPLQNMRKGTMREEDWTKLARTMGAISEAPLYIDDSPNMSLMEIRSKCRRLKQRADLKLVIVDYLQLMTSGKRVESRQQEVSEFSRALKLLAKELEVPVIALSQLNRGPEQRTDKKPQMSDLRESGCLTADTRVLRADTGAETTLEELFALQARDVPVWALDDSLRYVRRHLTHVFPTGVKPVFRLRLASGKEVRATANHPFLTYDGWRPLGELGAGDRLAVPRHVPGPERVASWEDERVLLLAHLLDDSPAGAGHRFEGAALPDEVFHLPKRRIALLLRELWSRCGGAEVRPAGDGGRLWLTVPSRELADGVARLLLRFGIAVSTSAAAEGEGRWTVDVTGRDEQRRFLQEIGTSGGEDGAGARLLSIVRRPAGPGPAPRGPQRVWDDVRALFTPVAEGAAPAAQPLGAMTALLDDADLEVVAVNDVLWDEVVAIEADGEEQVFDATVAGGHNFVANGIAVHNSIEQDADMVVLLHREDMYEKESPRAGEADFIVAKHRNGPTDTITVAFQGHYSRFVDMAT